MKQSYFKYHVFICCNQREDNSICCNQFGSKKIQEYIKKRIKDLNLNGIRKIRINQAGCLDRCPEGPVLVVYPEETWYTYVDESDIDEIIESHLINGKIVSRLQI